MTLYAGLDLGRTTSLAIVEIGIGKPKLVDFGQIDLGEHDKTNPSQDLARKLTKISRFLKNSLIEAGSIRKLLIEEPPLVRNVKVYKYLSAYYGAALVTAHSCGNVIETQCLTVQGWRKLLEAVVTFKKNEFSPDVRTKIVKMAVAMQLELLTGMKFKPDEHDKADAVGLAVAASK